MSNPVLDIIKTRRSIRAFLPDEIPDPLIAQILAAGSWAPSAGNVQPWHFYLVRESYLKSKLALSAVGQKHIAQAPLVIVVAADQAKAMQAYQARGKDLYCLQDTAAAMQNMLLAAHSLGLGSCWAGAFDEDAVKKLLRLPPAHRPVALLALGKAAGVVPNPGRHPMHLVYTEVE